MAGASPRHRATIHLQKPLLLTTLILLALTTGIGTVQAQSGTCGPPETFESYSLLSLPGGLSGCWYENDPDGTTFVDSAQALSGTKSYYMENAANMKFVYGGTVNVPENVPIVNEPLTLTYQAAVRFNALPGSSTPLTFGQVLAAGTGCNSQSNGACLEFLSTGAVRCGYADSSGIFQSTTLALTAAINTWYEITLFIEYDADHDSDTDGGGPDTDTDSDEAERAGCTVRDVPANIPYSGVVSISSIDDTGCPTACTTWPNTNAVHFTAGGSTLDYWVDDVSVGLPGELSAAGFVFCANPNLAAGEDGSIDDFGYEYVEGVQYFQDLADVGGPGDELGFELGDGFVFEGDSGNADYLGKGFDTGSTHLSVIARLEAGVEGTQTLFRLAFTEGEDGAPSITTKGDGTDGGNFDNHVQARFKETGNDWTIGIYANVAGAGLTLLGSSVTHGNPNSPTTYNFTVDSEATTAIVYDDVGNIVIARNLPVGLQDSVFMDQWFVGLGDTGAINAFTVLDDVEGEADQDDDSTCIYDHTGNLQVSNNQGLQAPSTVPNTPEPPVTDGGGFDDLAEDFGNVFGGIGAEGGAIFLAIFWILVFAAGAYGILGGSPLAIGIGALCGFIFSIFTGLIPDILVFIVVLLAGAAVGMRLFAGGGNGADG